MLPGMTFALVSWLVVQDASGRVLLGRRAAGSAYGEGLWGLPGGRVERGETLAGAACREALEELGVQVAAGAVQSLGVCRYDLGGDTGADYFFLAREWQGEPRALDKTSEVGWFRPGDLPPDTLPWLEGVLDAHLRRGLRLTEILDSWSGVRAISPEQQQPGTPRAPAP